MTFRSWMLAAGLLAVPLVGGCGRPVPPVAVTATEREPENPWGKAVSALRKDTDAGTGRRVLADLSTTGVGPGGSALPALSDAEKTLAKTTLGLTDEEVKEIAGAAFTGLDAAYLAECFYLRDVGGTLDAGKLTPAAKAARALAWVGRQVQRMPMGTVVPAPATYTLRRGSGSGLDRATVFAAICQQLGLDAVFVGTPAANNWPPANTTAGQPIPEPFWAVGVRDGTAILLFDPLRGVPVPGPTVDQPATLAQLKANPDLLKPWATDGKGALPTADEIKASVVFPAVPLSAVSARMATFQVGAGEELGVHAAVDVAALEKSIQACGEKLTPWASPRFSLTPLRSLRLYLPATEGGSAPSPSPLFQDYYRPQLPAFPPLPAGSELGLAERSGKTIGSTYLGVVLETQPREKLQRGQYLDAARLLVRQRDEFRAFGEQARDPARRAVVAKWLTDLNGLYQKLRVANLDSGSDAARQLEVDIEKEWKEKVVAALVYEAVADPIFNEATYLLALTKHEQAERAQASGAADAKAKWREANSWWQRYLPLAAAQDKSFPGRAAHAQALATAARDATFQ